MLVITVRQGLKVSASCGGDPAESRQYSLKILYYQPGVDKIDATTIEVKIPEALPQDSINEIRWYLEDHIQQPLETERAAKGRAALRHHGQGIIAALDLASTTQISLSDEVVIFKVCLSSNANSTSHVFWELLENKGLWPDPAPREVIVTRLPNLPATKTIQPVHNAENFNILVVSARPDADEDLPPRLVSKVLASLVEESKSESTVRASLDIVRPPTLDAFQECLNKHPNGHYNVVHFDMHGVENGSRKTFLRFLQNNSRAQSLQLIPHDVESQVIGELLYAHEIPHAVLNACRSAKGATVDTNIALALLRAGVRACVAMAFNTIGASVQIFTSAFYDALVHGAVSFPQSTMLARRALRDAKQRWSRFGQAINFDDSMVPIVYLQEGEHGDLYREPRRRLRPPLDAKILKHFPLGRENDMLKIESILLIEKKPLLIVGDAGVGKSSIVNELGEWWEVTGLFHESCLIRLSPHAIWDLDKVLEIFNRALRPEIEYRGVLDFLDYIQFASNLLVLDGLDVITVPSGKLPRQKRRDLIQLVQCATDRKIPLILTSRAPENWLNSFVIVYNLGGLTRLSSCELFESLIVMEKQEQDAIIHVGSVEYREYIEQLVKLADGNPLAIALLAVLLIKSKKSPKGFFTAMLLGESFHLDIDAMSQDEGFRSMVDIVSLISRIEVEASTNNFIPAILGPFWGCLVYEDLAVYFWYYLQELIKPIGLNPTQRQLRMEKSIAALNLQDSTAAPSMDGALSDFFTEQSLGSSLESMEPPSDADTEVDFDEKSLIYPEITLETMRESDDIVQLWALFEPAIETLKGHLFLQDFHVSSLQRSLLPRTYISVHPLFSIMLRTTAKWRTDCSYFVRAFATYTTKRMQAWPINRAYSDQIWNSVNMEIAVEFFNFTGAAIMFLHGCESFIKHISMMKVLRCISHGAVNNASREPILLGLWEMVLSLLKKQETELRSSNRVDGKPPPIPKSFPWNLSSTQSVPEWRSLDFYIPYDRLRFQVQYQIFMFSMLLMTHRYRVNSARKSELLELCERVYREIFENGVPEEESPELIRADLDHNLLVARVALGKVPFSHDELWMSRESRNKAYKDKDEAEYPQMAPKGFFDLQLDALGPAAKFAHFIPASLQIDAAIGEGRLEEARKLIDETLFMEINEGGNDLTNKAKLLHYLSEIDELEGKSVDAQKHAEEASAMEQEAAGSRMVNLAKDD